MKKTKEFIRARFSVEVLKNAIDLFWEETHSVGKLSEMRITVDNETWHHDDLDEFFADYRRAPSGEFWFDIISGEDRFMICEFRGGTNVSVSASDRGKIEKVFAIFEANYPKSLVLAPSPPVVFIGHGNNLSWRDLKDHLQDKHGYEVVAYETGARAGHVIRDILDDMASRSTIAFLVLTAEDEQGDGQFHARQNVIHETGLFQGRLGFNRAIVMIENGVEPFSNLQGIEQIRFFNIKEAFGEVLATIKRETEQS